MKKFVSLFLSLVMLISVTAGLSFSANAATYEITLGQSRNPNIVFAGKSVSFVFTPQKDVTAAFYTLAFGKDTCAVLYDAEGNVLVYDDDSGFDYNAKIVYDFAAGEPYYFEVGFYSEEETGVIPTCLDEYSSGETSTFYYEFFGNKAAVAYNFERQQSVPENFTITGTIGGRPVTFISDGAFYNQEGKTEGLKSVTIPNSVKYIAEAAFNNCYDLETVKLGTGVQNIGPYAFSDTALKAVTLPDSLQYIGDGAFAYTSVGSSVTIPKKVSYVAGDAFLYSLLTAYKVAPENKYYKAVDGVLFSKDGKTLVSFPYYKDQTVYSYSVPNGVEAIGPYAFEGVYLNIVELPGSLKTIGKYSFAETHIYTMNIPASVSYIAEGAFYDSSSCVRILGTDTEIDSYAFYRFYGLLCIHPDSTAEEFVLNYPAKDENELEYSYFCEDIDAEHDFSSAGEGTGYIFIQCSNCGEYYKELGVTNIQCTKAYQNKLDLVCDVTPGAAGYDVWVEDADGNVVQTVFYARRGTVTGLQPATEYYVYFRAFNSAGEAITDWSFDSLFYTTPTKVTGVKTTARGGTGERLKIEWDAQENADGYNIWLLQGGSYVLYGMSETNSFVFEDLVPGWEYYIRVTAFKGYQSNAGFGSDVHHTCAACPPIETYSAEINDNGSVTVDWEMVNAHGYVVMWSTDPNFASGNEYAYVVGHESTTYTFTPSGNAEDYYVRVRPWRYWENNTLVYGIWTAGLALSPAE